MRELHEKLMRGVRGDTATPGEFRRSQNWIGPPGCTPETATYVPPPADELMACLGPWEQFLHDRSPPSLVHAALVHAQFEEVHPFLDGNGRVGRLSITLLLVERDVLPTPLLYLSAFFEATRRDYYAHLLALTREGAWEEWLDYFLAGVENQAEDALRRIRRIDELLLGWREQLGGMAAKTPEKALELLVENPFWTVKKLAERLDVAFTTGQRAIDRLESAGIVTQTDEAKRNRVYCARDLLAILEEPPAIGRDP